MAGLVGCGNEPSVTSEASEPTTATVQHVIDGDTLAVTIDGVDERVRLIGIDSPELNPGGPEPPECHAREATELLASLLPPGTAVLLEGDTSPRDRFDRLLAYVHRVDDDLFVNLALVEAGAADARRYPPDTARTTDLERAEQTARSAGLGIWRCPSP